MPYTPPDHDNVIINFHESPYTPPDHNTIELNFGVTNEEGGGGGPTWQSYIMSSMLMFA